MIKNQNYLMEIDDMAALDTPLKDEGEAWWKK